MPARQFQECDQPDGALTPFAWEGRLSVLIAKVVEVDPKAVDIHQPLADLGLSSVQATELAGVIGGWLGRQVSPVVAFKYPTIRDLAEQLATGEI